MSSKAKTFVYGITGLIAIIGIIGILAFYIIPVSEDYYLYFFSIALVSSYSGIFTYYRLRTKERFGAPPVPGFLEK